METPTRIARPIARYVVRAHKAIVVLHEGRLGIQWVPDRYTWRSRHIEVAGDRA